MKPIDIVFLVVGLFLCYRLFFTDSNIGRILGMIAGLVTLWLNWEKIAEFGRNLFKQDSRN
jgi:hypothetical protein